MAHTLALWCQPLKTAISTRTYDLTNVHSGGHDGTVLHNVVTMDQAIALGIGRRSVYRLVDRGDWVRLGEGIFLTTPSTGDDARWKAELAGLILRYPNAMISHRAAARLHAMEGVIERAAEATVSAVAHRAPPGVHRTRHLDPGPVLVDGLTTTSIVRTLRDLAAVRPAFMVEQALESMLRGSDPRRPDQWKTALLAELRRSVEDGLRLPGTFRLRAVLELRNDVDRPTGSFPETLLFQMLRGIGFHAVRQPTLRITDGSGVTLDTFFPDIALPQFRSLVEVDGAEAHSGSAALARDLRRQNKILRGFRLFRYPAIDILRDARSIALEIRRDAFRSTPVDESWCHDGVSVTYSTNEFVVVDAARDARTEARLRRRVG